MSYTKILLIERNKRKLKQKEIARQLGISQDLYSKYERGDREPNIDTIIKIADLYHISTNYLLGRYSK